MFLILDLKKYKRIFKSIFFVMLLAIILVLGIRFINYIFPIEYENIIQKCAEKYNVEKSLIFAVINAESRFDGNAVSNKGAKGLMQIMPDTAIWIAEKAKIDGITKENYYEVENNINLGVWYLSYFLEKYNSKNLALASYNAGRGNVLKWLNDKRYSNDGKTLHTIPFGETDRYIKKIQILQKGYEIIFKIKDKLNLK